MTTNAQTAHFFDVMGEPITGASRELRMGTLGPKHDKC